MGRADGQTATGPRQNNVQGLQQNFSHMDTMDCSSCHASWTKNGIGCHHTAYNANPDNYFFSNITESASSYRNWQQISSTKRRS